jgi:polar amino acid transport system substrate-binding protein
MTFKRPIFLLLVILLGCPNVFAQDDSTAVNEIQINIVAPELKPLIYRNSEDKSSGLIIDMLNQVNEDSILNVKVTILPWARAMKQVMIGQADGIMPALYTKERSQVLAFPRKPLVNFNGSVLIKRKSDNFEFTGFDDIKSKKSVAKVRAVLLGKPFERAKSKNIVNVVEVTKLEDALNMLLLDRVDLVISDAYAAASAIKSMKIENKATIMEISKTTEPSYLAFSLKFSQKHDINEIMSIINQHNNPNSYQGVLNNQ